MRNIISEKDISRDLDEIQQELELREGNLVASPSDFFDRVSQIAEHGDEQQGESLPFGNDYDVLKLRKGELTVWGGVNGHGKSLVLGQVIGRLLRSQKALIASLEMKPEQTLYRMICQHAGVRACAEYSREILARYENRLWIYDQLDTVQANRILALVHYASKVLGVDHIVIDSLTKCGLAHEDYTAEKKFIDRLQWSAKTLGVHIHLVVHIRKGIDEHRIPDKFDIKGSGAITDLADNIAIVWRNKKREAALKKQSSGGLLTDAELAQIEEKRDAILNICKNRHGGDEGFMGLYFHRMSGQFMSQDSMRPMVEPF